MEMTLTEEKQTANAVSFVVEMPATGNPSEKELAIIARLEAEGNANAPATLEQINAKLEKAEAKRKMSTQGINSEEKRQKVLQRKLSIDEATSEKKEELESQLNAAEKNREQAINNKLAKVHEHLEKVEQVRKTK